MFPAHNVSTDPRSGAKRRHHIHESSLQKAMKNAVRLAGIAQHVGCHTFRHYLEFRIMSNSTINSLPYNKLVLS